MNQKELDSLAAAKQLSRAVLGKADSVFEHKRRAMETTYHFRNGIFSRV